MENDLKTKEISEKTETVKNNEKETIIQESTKEEKNIKGIKLPWWIGYTLLILIILLTAFFIYELFSISFTKKTVAPINNTPFTILCQKNEIAVGETIIIEVNK